MSIEATGYYFGLATIGNFAGFKGNHAWDCVKDIDGVELCLGLKTGNSNFTFQTMYSFLRLE